MIKDYIIVSWILYALYAIFKYWYIVSSTILLMGCTLIIRCAVKLQRFDIAKLRRGKQA